MSDAIERALEKQREHAAQNQQAAIPLPVSKEKEHVEMHNHQKTPPLPVKTRGPSRAGHKSINKAIPRVGVGPGSRLDDEALLAYYKQARREGRTLHQVAKGFRVSDNAVYLHLKRFNMSAKDYREGRFPDQHLQHLQPLPTRKSRLMASPPMTEKPAPAPAKAEAANVVTVQVKPETMALIDSQYRPVTAPTGSPTAHAARIADMAVELGAEVEKLQLELRQQDEKGVLGILRAAHDLVAVFAEMKHMVPANTPDDQIVIMLPRVTAGMIRRADGLLTQMLQRGIVKGA